MRYFTNSFKKAHLIKMDYKKNKLIDGIKLSESVSYKLKKYLEEKRQTLGDLYRAPNLKIIQVGNEIGSSIYIQNKLKQCDYIGIHGQFKKFNSNISTEDLIKEIKNSNNDQLVDAIIIQLPLPNSINTNEILSYLNPDKDVDCLTPYNQGRFLQSSTDDNIVIGRGITAGLPISILLQKYNATVTLCHSKTKNIEKYCREADILVTAIGKPKYFNEDMVKDNAIVIDVGINSDSSGDKREVVGDVDINNVIDKIKFITPVPGGIGRMTVVMLMKNVINVWEKSINNKKYE